MMIEIRLLFLCYLHFTNSVSTQFINKAKSVWLKIFNRPAVCFTDQSTQLTFEIIFLCNVPAAGKRILLNSGYISSADLGVAFGLEILHSGL